MKRYDSRTVTELCSTFPGSTVDNTFGEDVDVHRIGSKMFALVNTGGGEIVTVKATPEDVVALVSEHDAITPGYYMNKKHWVTVDLTAGFDAAELAELVNESHRLVMAGLPKYLQRELQAGGQTGE